MKRISLILSLFVLTAPVYAKDSYKWKSGYSIGGLKNNVGLSYSTPAAWGDEKSHFFHIDYKYLYSHDPEMDVTYSSDDTFGPSDVRSKSHMVSGGFTYHAQQAPLLAQFLTLDLSIFASRDSDRIRISDLSGANGTYERNLETWNAGVCFGVGFSLRSYLGPLLLEAGISACGPLSSRRIAIEEEGYTDFFEPVRDRWEDKKGQYTGIGLIAIGWLQN